MANQELLHIEVLDGDRVLASGQLESRKVIIGRILSTDFRVADPRISRIHALLEWLDDGQLRITDLASTHGTFVNGQKILEKVIQPSDDVKLANLTLRLRWKAADRRLDVPSPDLSTSPKSAAPSMGASQEPKPQVAVQVAPGVSVSRPTSTRESTQVVSLKQMARTRGVLEAAGPNEELEVTVFWQETILAIEHFSKANRVLTVGNTPGSSFLIAESQIPDGFEFLKIQSAQCELRFHPTMKGCVRTRGSLQTLEQLMTSGLSSVTLGAQDIAKIQIGQVHFFVMFVGQAPKIPMAPLFQPGAALWKSLAMVLLLVGSLLGVGTLFRQPLEGRVTEFPEKYRRILVESYKQFEENKKKIEGEQEKPGVKVPDAQMVADTPRRGGNEGEGARERGVEGKRGFKDSPTETGITNRPKRNQNVARQDVSDGKVVGGQGGILEALKNTGLGSRLAKVAGDSGGSSGNDPLAQPLLGTGGGGIQSGRGSGGSGLQGTGSGGGGNAVGVGGLGTKGFGGGARGSGVGSIPGKGEFAVGTETLGVTVLGGLSREEIERVVNANRNEILFCYLRELEKDSSLFGKVSMKWSIVSGGRVTDLKTLENTTGSKTLENCIRSRVSSWQFPSPPAGSKADVEWPWTLKPKG